MKGKKEQKIYGKTITRQELEEKGQKTMPGYTGLYRPKNNNQCYEKPRDERGRFVSTKNEQKSFFSIFKKKR